MSTVSQHVEQDGRAIISGRGRVRGRIEDAP
jgi:hypothetical protein